MSRLFLVSLILAFLVTKISSRYIPLKEEPFKLKDRLGGEVDGLKSQLSPFRGLLDKLNNIHECSLPTYQMIDEDVKEYRKLPEETKRIISDTEEYRSYDLLKKTFFSDWDEFKLKLDPKLFIKPAINRAMLSRVFDYQIKAFGFSSCENVENTVGVDDIEIKPEERKAGSVVSSMNTYIQNLGRVPVEVN